MKYPASPIIGGRRKRKKISGVKVVGISSLRKKKQKPIMRPIMMRILDSGIYVLIPGVM